jgi:nuclear transport factor 2 (NTF2) superfamily protein
MDRNSVERWVHGYERAWGSNDPTDIGALFTDDALYRFHPYDEPLRGREAIVAQWIQNKDEPEDYRFGFEVAGVDGNLAFVHGWTDYFTSPHRTYSNLWEIRLAPDGRCEDFTEWFMRHPA